MKHLLLLLVTLSSIVVSAQKLEVKGKKYFLNNEQVATYEVKKLMKDTDYAAYANFKSYTSKTSWGGFLIGFGGAMIVADAVKSIASKEDYPGVMSAIGAASLIASFPVMKGRSKKLEKAVDLYNEAVTTPDQSKSNFEINIVANNRGMGLQLNF